MSGGRIKLNVRLAVLVIFFMSGPFNGFALSHSGGGVDSRFPPAFSILPARVLQATSYPAPTAGSTSGYPAQPTATTGSGYPGPQTATPGGRVSPTSLVAASGTVAATTPVLAEGTPLPSATSGSDIYLTENAEMGQSKATPLPTDTPAPSATVTLTPTVTPSSTAAPLEEGFQMNWGAFMAAFLVVIVIGGAAWLTFLRRFLIPKN